MSEQAAEALTTKKDGWTVAGRPLRKVTHSTVRVGRGSLLGGDSTRRVWWWDLELQCGHAVQRYVRYRPLRDDEPRIRGGRVNRPHADRLPPPKSARCDDCPQDISPGQPTSPEATS